MLQNPGKSRKFPQWLGRSRQILGACPSTNAEAAQLADAPDGHLVWARRQTAGKGQRGNSWESQAGQNLTFSLVLYPKFLSPQQQFRLSQVLCLGAARALSDLAGQRVHLKWPNDLYAEDLKLGGLLLETQIRQGQIGRVVAGLGLNINQVDFASPRATSLRLLTGRSWTLEECLETTLGHIEYCYEALRGGKEVWLHQTYLAALLGWNQWRPYRDVASDKLFEGQIVDVAPSGLLTLADESGQEHHYQFKEVEWLF